MSVLSSRIALASALAVFATGTAVAAADVTISSQPGGVDLYAAPVYSMNAGERAFFQNPSGNSHNVTAKLKGPDGRALFRSRTISSGTTPVDGVQYLKGGVYDFHCTIHAGMEAKLDVSTSAGTPAARPDIEVAVPAQPLASVRRSGKLKVRVRALTDSDNVALLARKGARRLGSKGGIDLGAGATRIIRLALTRSGRKALAGSATAAVSVRGTVPFGSPDLANRRLR